MGIKLVRIGGPTKKPETLACGCVIQDAAGSTHLGRNRWIVDQELIRCPEHLKSQENKGGK